MEENFKAFGLSEEIYNATEKLGFDTPTNVQGEVIPLALKDIDIIVQSQTGSGKTAAFGIPVCEKIDIEGNDPQVLILTPTRELAVQVKEDITNIGRFKRVRVAAVFGKQPITLQTKELKQRVHIVVGTPGRTMDLIERKSLNTSKIKYLILDEADKMLQMGFIEQVEEVIKTLPSKRVTMLFSATLPERIQGICNRYMNNPQRVEIASESITAEKVVQEYYEVENDNRVSILNKIIFMENPDSCILFCKTKDSVDVLIKEMSKRGYTCNSLHGGMLQKDRLEVMQSFKRGEFRFLAATDVAARGIDVDNLTHIINYEVPVELDSYVHRIGRTGRAGSSGKAITLVSPNEQRFFGEIQKYIGYQIPKKELPEKWEIEKARAVFNETREDIPKPKLVKGASFKDEITKIHINAGKKKKIRPGDIVGAVSSVEGIEATDIGIIDIQDSYSYIDILNGKGNLVLEGLKEKTIKGKIVRIQKAEK